MRIVLLHSRLSGYMTACLREFQKHASAELLIYAWPNQPDAPFDSSKFENLGKVINRYDCSNETILKQILEFQPTAILASGWRDKGYVKICRALKSKGILIIAGCDTQWKASLKQYFASWVAPLHIQKIIDVLWVTGERQRYLAQALGYTGEQCWRGYYACDWASFANQSIHQNSTHAPYFLYVGRYAPEKGLDILSAAYKNYTAQVKAPWRLVCAGAGPLKNTLLQSGAEDKGFVQPEDLPTLMKGASAFVLPSRFEPWGVVAQEAAASGLPLILSEACGAGVHLLHDHYNGFSFSTDSVESLTQALRAMHSLPSQQRQLFSQASYELSKQYTPKRWAATLLQGLQRLNAYSS